MNRTQSPSTTWIPPVTFLTLAAVFLGFKVEFDRHQKETLLLETAQTGGQVAARLEEAIEARLAWCRTLVYEFESGELDSEIAFTKQITSGLQHFKGLQAVNWIDPEGFIRWVVPEDDNRPAKGRFLREHPVAGPVLLAAEEEGVAKASPPLELYQGGRGFTVYLPLTSGGAPGGFLNVVFRIEPLLSESLRDGVQGLQYCLTDGRWRFFESEGDKLDEYETTQSIQIVDRTWDVTFSPEPQVLADASTFLDEAMLGFGILLALGLSWVLARLIKSQRSLKRRTEKLQAVCHAYPDHHCSLDAEARIVDHISSSRPPLRQLHLGEDLTSIFPTEVTTQFRETIQEVLHSGNLKSFEFHDGEDPGRHYEARLVPLDAEAIYCLLRDITARKDVETEKERLTEELRQSHKMEAVGQLAGGIAHDFNNLLTAILGHSGSLLLRLSSENPPGRDDFREGLEQIQHAGERAASLTNQLLSFSRSQPTRLQVLKPRAILEQTVDMLRRLIRENIDLHVEEGKSECPLMADPLQIEQILMNLVVNAQDAMPEGGRLTLECTDVEVNEAVAQRHAQVRSGSFVCFSVSDTGTGIPENIRSRLFEPFFTTKPVGQGTGLGLSTVYGIVHRAKGFIELESRVGEGTCFRVYLPAAPDEKPRKEDDSRIESVHGNETILLCEDEDAVRRITSNVLRSAGYRVLEASGGPDAVKISETTQEPLHLVISDVIMPDMNGRDVVTTVGKKHQTIRKLLISGYTADVMAESPRDDEIHLLQKPFGPKELLVKVRAIMDNRPTNATVPPRA